MQTLHPTQCVIAKKGSAAKQKMKYCVDKYRHSHSKPQKFSVGDLVVARQAKVNKFSTPFQAEPFRIKEVKGSMITATAKDQTITIEMRLTLSCYLQILRCQSPVRRKKWRREEKIRQIRMIKQLAPTIVGIHLEVAEMQNQTTNHNQGTVYKPHGQLSNISKIILYIYIKLSLSVEVQIHLRMKGM